MKICMKISLASMVLGLAYLPSVIAWGELGHNTTAYLASYFVSNSTAAYLKDLLKYHEDDYLARIATYADEYSHRPEGKFTGQWHYIDAHDKPAAGKCNVKYARDCKRGGCIISALTNLTERAVDRELPKEDQQFAVKLIVHFIGDLHQPLHNEDIKGGGTQIDVKWRSESDTLHRVWDRYIPEKLIEHMHGERSELALRWASELADEISNGKFATEKNGWLVGFDLSHPKKTALIWSSEANKYVCSHVFPKGYEPDKIEGKQLSEEYYDQASPIVQRQVARAGYRMAAWLDEIARNNWEKEVNSETNEL